MEKIIKVKGVATAFVRPDRTELLITLTGENEDHGRAVALSAEKTEALRACFAANGFAPDDLKTTNFNVSAKYENYTDEAGRYKQRFAGYEFRHSLKIGFPAGEENLGRAAAALSVCPADPEFQIVYTVSDKESVKNELLKKAVARSREKAAVLAEAAGVALGSIVNIDHSWEDMAMEVRPMGKMLMAEAAGLNITPEDIEITDSVTVTWEIK